MFTGVMNCSMAAAGAGGAGATSLGIFQVTVGDRQFRQTGNTESNVAQAGSNKESTGKQQPMVAGDRHNVTMVAGRQIHFRGVEMIPSKRGSHRCHHVVFPR